MATTQRTCDLDASALKAAGRMLNVEAVRPTLHKGGKLN